MDQITHRRFISHGDAHYAGGIVDGAYILRMFGEIATDLSLLISRDEGLLAGYERVDFKAPIFAGDVIESTGIIIDVGNRSRRIEFNARMITASALDALDTSLRTSGMVVASAVGTLVISRAAASIFEQNL